MRRSPKPVKQRCFLVYSFGWGYGSVESVFEDDELPATSGGGLYWTASLRLEGGCLLQRLYYLCQRFHRGQMHAHNFAFCFQQGFVIAQRLRADECAEGQAL